MNAIAKRPAIKPSDAQIGRWWRRHTVDIDGNPPEWRPTPYSELIAVVDRFANKANTLLRAMHDPTIPGAVDVIASASELLEDTGKGCFAWHDSEIESYGEAIAWGLRGAPAAEVEAERERMRAACVEAQKAAERKNDPGEITKRTMQTVGFYANELIGRALNDGHPSLRYGLRALTYEERVELLQRLTIALLGYPVCFDYDEPTMGPYELPTAQPSPATTTKAKRKGGR